jgi:hypothetical protein
METRTRGKLKQLTWQEVIKLSNENRKLAANLAKMISK